jgi:AAA family ATP:ADP antiporter
MILSGRDGNIRKARHCIAITNLETPANTLFLSRFSIDKLPQVYVATAMVCIAIGLVFARLESRISVRTLLTGTLGFLSIVTLAFYFGLSVAQSQSVVFGVMVWKDVHWTLTNLEFWALAGLLLDVRQGKRLFGMIALGEIVAGMLGGFSVPLFVRSGGTLLVLVASAAATIASMCLLIYTLHRAAAQHVAVLDEGPEHRKPWLTLFKDRYLALFFGVSALSLFGEFFIDYSFYNRVELAFTDEAKLASFFGLFYGVLGAAQLVSSLWVSGRCLTRYGLSFGLMALPLAALATTGVASLAEFFQAAIAVLFWAIVSAKSFDQVIRDTIEIPSGRILYQPLPANQRLRVQTIRETIVEPLSLGLVGVLLLAGQSLFAIQAAQVLYLTVAVAIVWAALSVLLRREYTVRLTRALTARRLGGGDLSLNDHSSMKILVRGLESTSAGQVIYCLDMIEDARHPSLEAKLVELLQHKSPLVRGHAISKIERLKLAGAATAISQRLAIEEIPEVKASLLRALCAAGEVDVLDQILPFLSDPVPAIRCGALVGLLRYCGAGGVLAASSHLNGLIGSAEPDNRQLAAEVLGEVGIGSFYPPLLDLVRDDHLAVRRAAMEAARKLHVAGAIPAMLEALDIVPLRTAASRALVELGDAALPLLDEAFRQPSRSPESQAALAHLMERIGTAGAAAILQREINHPDGGVRMKVLAALVHCREIASAPENAAAHTMITREAEEAAWALAVWADIEGDAAHAELFQALLGELDACKERIYLLLSLVYSPIVIRKARLDLEKGTAQKKAHALEVLDNLLPEDLKRYVFPLIDLISPHERKKLLHMLFPQPRLAPAVQDYASAQTALGTLYYYGDSVKQDYAVAAQWYRKAADQNNADALYDLGYMQENGLGMKIEQNCLNAMGGHRNRSFYACEDG